MTVEARFVMAHGTISAGTQAGQSRNVRGRGPTLWRCDQGES